MNEAGQTQTLVRLASQSVERMHMPGNHVRIGNRATYRGNGMASAAAGRKHSGSGKYAGAAIF